MAIARALAMIINFRYGSAPAAAGANGAIEALYEDGIAQLPSLLSAGELREIEAWLLAHPLVHSNAYTLETVLNCPHVLRLAGDASILAIARAYLGCVPTLASIGIRWSFCQSQSDVQLFHRDMDDWRSLKLFIYLTDVDAGSGPHAYVLRSHKGKSRLRARPYRLDEVEAEYGRGAVFRVIGPAGTTFVADTYGIHRGDVPAERPRLLLQIQYSVLPNFSLLYRPVSLADGESPVDRYTGRLLLK
jgi:hypothetical protein